jgi:hypothetical protein
LLSREEGDPLRDSQKAEVLADTLQVQDQPVDGSLEPAVTETVSGAMHAYVAESEQKLPTLRWPYHGTESLECRDQKNIPNTVMFTRASDNISCECPPQAAAPTSTKTVSRGIQTELYVSPKNNLMYLTVSASSVTSSQSLQQNESGLLLEFELGTLRSLMKESTETLTRRG